MASTYSDLKIQLMSTGENSGTWGNVTNTNLGTAIEEAICAISAITFASADITLTATDTNETQPFRHMVLGLIGTSGGARNLILPGVQKLYVIRNSVADPVTVKNATGNSITVPSGKTMWVYNNGTDVETVVTYLTDLALGSPLAITSGGTGTNSTTYCNVQANVTGVLPIGNGGTGTNSTTYCNVQSNITGTLPIANGGTGATSSGAAATALGLGTSNSVQFSSLGVGTAASGTAGEIRATNNVTAYYSDDRLKTRLGKIENALDKLCSLDGFYYEANETAQALGYESVREIGVSAQSTQAVLPEIVAPAPIDDKYLTVRYEKFAPLFIEAIKELRAEVDALKGK